MEESMHSASHCSGLKSAGSPSPMGLLPDARAVPVSICVLVGLHTPMCCHIKLSFTSSTPPRWCQVSRAASWQETYMAQTHFAKRKQVGITLTKIYWLLGRKSKLSTSNKHILYEAKLKAIWTYGIQLWGTASTSSTEILEVYQSKALRMIVDAPRYVPNAVIRSSQYSARFSAHANGLVVNLTEQPDNRRLRRHLPNDLPTTFLVKLSYL
jgi:hypothetical protein